MKILVVDDSLSSRRLALRELNGLGYTEIIEANDGREALIELKKDPGIKLVLLDRYMPNMDGLEFIKTFKGDSGNRFVPVAMVTSEGDKAEIVRTLIDYQADYYITKPLTRQALLRMFSELFKE